MAVLYNGNADYLRADASDIDDWTAFTFIAYFDPDTVQETFLARKGISKKLFQTDPAVTDELVLYVVRAGIDAHAFSNNFNMATDIWYFVAATYDETDGPRLFFGDLNTAPVEAGYTTRTVGTLATAVDPGFLYVCNRDNNDARRLSGELAHFAYINKRLTLGEITAQWMRPHVIEETKVFLLPGQVGDAATVPNLCDSNAVFTANGITLADHAPLPPPFGFFQDWEPYEELFRIPRHPAIIYQTPAVV